MLVPISENERLKATTSYLLRLYHTGQEPGWLKDNHAAALTQVYGGLLDTLSDADMYMPQFYANSAAQWEDVETGYEMIIAVNTDNNNPKWHDIKISAYVEMLTKLTPQIKYLGIQELKDDPIFSPGGGNVNPPVGGGEAIFTLIAILLIVWIVIPYMGV